MPYQDRPTKLTPPTGWRLWWIAARPKTLTISMVPVIVGTAAAWAETATVSAVVAVVALLSALFIQTGTNLYNDAADHDRGTDTQARLGPKRVTAQGWVSARKVYAAAALCFVLASAAGCYLIWLGGWPILVLGVVSLFSGYWYSGGPKPLAHTPFGEVFVFAFFGLGAVGGTYYLHTGTYSTGALIAGSAVGLLASAVMLVNNYRDFDSDRDAGRVTLAIRLGRNASKFIFAAFLLGAYVLLIPWAAWDERWTMMVFAALALPVFAFLIARFWREPPGAAFNRILAQTALAQVIFGVLLSVGLVV